MTNPFASPNPNGLLAQQPRDGVVDTDPYFLLRDRIEAQISRINTEKDTQVLQKDLTMLKATIDSVLENPRLFPHINTSIELPQRMAFYQSMSARLAALKRYPSETEEAAAEQQEKQVATTTTVFHFEPSSSEHRHLDHLITVVGNVRDQARQIHSEIETQKR